MEGNPEARSGFSCAGSPSVTRSLWQARGETDEYIGTLVNAYIAEGGAAVAVAAGTAYVDVGTLGGYREAMRLLADEAIGREARIAPLSHAARGR